MFLPEPFLPIPDPGVKKAPDPGPATLPYTDLHVLIQIILLARWLQWSRSQILLLLLSILFLILLWLSLGARTSLKGGKRVCGTDRD